jgi:hypothetical protein
MHNPSEGCRAFSQCSKQNTTMDDYGLWYDLYGTNHRHGRRCGLTVKLIDFDMPGVIFRSQLVTDRPLLSHLVPEPSVHFEIQYIMFGPVVGSFGRMDRFVLLPSSITTDKLMATLFHRDGTTRTSKQPP